MKNESIDNALASLRNPCDFFKILFLKRYIRIIKSDNERLRIENNEVKQDIASLLDSNRSISIKRLKDKIERQKKELQRQQEIIIKLKNQ